MSFTGPVRRWDMFWANLEPSVVSEQGGRRRPVIVISNNGYNTVFDAITVISAPKLEGKARKAYTFEVILPKKAITPQWASIVMPQQIRSISKKRLQERIGTLDDELLQREIENRLLEHLGIAFEADDEPGSMG